MNKVSIIFALLVFWIFSPLLFMLFNIGGFAQINDDLVNDMFSEQDKINIFTLAGFSTFLNFLFSLAVYSVFNNQVVIVIFYTFLSAVSLVVAFLVARGGGS